MTTRLIDKLWGVVPTVREAPEGWLTIAEFAARAGDMAVRQIYKGIDDGKISRKHMAILNVSGEQRVVLIDWDAAAYDFVIQRRPGSRPEDFVQNPAREYKPFRTTPQQDAIDEAVAQRRAEITSHIDGGTPGSPLSGQTQDIVDERLVNDQMVVQPVIDNTSAKFREIQLNVEKKSLELRMLANEVISFDTQRSMMGGISAELNGNASKAIPKWSPIFAAEDDPRVVRQLMKQMFVDILKPMENSDEDS